MQEVEEPSIGYGYSPGPLQQKSFDFAVRIVSAFRHLQKTGVEVSLLRQMLRSATSVGANVEEALGAISTKEFQAKLQIAYKEIRETDYWIRLLVHTELLDRKPGESLSQDCREVRRLITATLRTSRGNSQ